MRYASELVKSWNVISVKVPFSHRSILFCFSCDVTVHFILSVTEWQYASFNFISVSLSLSTCNLCVCSVHILTEKLKNSMEELEGIQSLNIRLSSVAIVEVLSTQKNKALVRFLSSLRIFQYFWDLPISFYGYL